MAAYSVLYDACVLYPAPLRDLLLRLPPKLVTFDQRVRRLAGAMHWSLVAWGRLAWVSQPGWSSWAMRHPAHEQVLPSIVGNVLDGSQSTIDTLLETRAASLGSIHVV